MPEKRSLGLLPPADHQVDLNPAAIDLQFQVKTFLTDAIAIAAFDPNMQIIQLSRRRRVDKNNGVSPRLAANISCLGNQSKKIQGVKATPEWSEAEHEWDQRESLD